MNILHVYPRFPKNTFWGFRYVLPIIGKKAAFPPLSLMTIGGMVKELRPDWNQKLVDLNVKKKLREKDLEWADLIFISAMILQEESVREVVKKCKKHGVKVVAGGPLFTSQEEETPGIDYFVLGEAEEILPLLLEDLDKNEPKHKYMSDRKPSLSLTPVPLWELVNFKHYVTMLVQFSRGCPHKCEFCDIRKLFGQKPRLKMQRSQQSQKQTLR